MDGLVWEGLRWLLWALVLVAGVLAGLWSYRVATAGETSFGLTWQFPRRPEPRLAVMEQTSVDRMRRLVLIRRDDVEHLIMTGGPVDVVIETGIAVPKEGAAAAASERQEPEPPVFARKSRGLGQAVNE
ncbi:MAG: flagellar biosynthetic protein FliO [Hyphomicrobiaceae bacterium]|nr:flagellar biosynthetic protein FliO [Hyphomicrobiaceae bacterium]